MEVSQKESEMLAFAGKVGQVVEQHYGLEDGADFCYTLLKEGFVNLNMSIQSAAREVAMRMS